MCGITGYWTREGSGDCFRRDLLLAIDSLRRRGPDDRGSWTGDPGVGLGHTRLAILDLSPHGHQPMVSPDGRLAMVFNGEVYNYAEIRGELKASGYCFSGSGDSEVVLAAFHYWGIAAVDRFIGMFSIALWDREARRLYLVRDRVGVKPLYYGWNGNALIFGSELRALRAFSQWPADIDQEALGELLQYGYIGAPRSIYRNIRKVPPGHWLELDADQDPRIQRYWSMDGSPRTFDLGEADSALEALLVDAVRYRMVADVPVGVFLSGGVDSSLVAALLQRQGGERVRTFTIGFREAKFDEAPWARRIAQHLGTDHTEVMLDALDARAILPQWADLYDEPFGDSSGIPTFLVSRVAREHVKVALSADGGDELFGGYSHYQLIADRYARLTSMPVPLRKMAAAMAQNRPLLNGVASLPIGRRRQHQVRRRVIDRFVKLGKVLPDVHPGKFVDVGRSFWQPEELDALLGGYEPPRQTLDHYPGDLRERMALDDFHAYLPDDIMAKVDRASMAAGLEAREPLLDHRVVEMAFSLPHDQRWGALGGKHILRQILYRYVPRSLIERPKQGFSIPLSLWLRNDFAEMVRDYLSESRIRQAGLMDPKAVARAVSNFFDGGEGGERVDVEKVWLLFAFEMWREKWM